MYKAQSIKEDLLNDQEDLLVRAFQLAFFIHANKDIALEISSNAFEMWEVICERQDKRQYYNLKGRFLANQEKKKQRSKVYMHEEQLLQRLIYKLSENYELTSVWSKSVDEEGLLVCYLKRLLSMMLKHNSFSAVVGMSRILHKYSNRETVKIYMSLAPNRTTQDVANIERESKRYKSKFFTQLKESFGNFLSVSKHENEERFEIVKDPDKFLSLLELVEDCLDRFKPWATECISSFNDFIFNDDNPDNEYPIELKRIHSVIHYSCYTQLTTTLNLAYPKDRLEIPLFSLTEKLNDKKNSQNRRKPPDATKELSIIPQKLEESAKRRKSTLSGILSIIVDGKEKTVFNLFTEKYKSLQLSENAELIEIRVKENGLLLTTHLITQEIAIKQQKPQNYKIKLEGGQTIDLIISFLENEQTNQEGKISLRIYYKETYFLRILIFMWRKLIYKINNFFQPYVVKPQIAIVLACFILIAFLSYFYFDFGYILLPQKPLTTKEEIKNPKPISIKEPPFNISDTSPNFNSSSKPDKLVKEKSLPKISKQNRKTDIPIIPPDFTERGVKQAKRLFAIKKLYIEVQNQEIQADVQDFITQNSTLKITDFIIQADAILQYSEEKKAVFLVSKTGDVLWQRELLKINFNEDNLINIINELLKEIETLKANKN